MLALPPFDFARAHDLDEAVSLLARHGAAARPLAGGTELLPRMKRRQESPELLVGLGGIPELHTMDLDADGNRAQRLGANITLHALETHPSLGRQFPLLAEAAASVATPILRRMGTLGGNLCQDTRCTFLDQSAFWRASIGGCLKCEGRICQVAPGSVRCWAVSGSDLAPPLIALGATVQVVGPNGSRKLPLEDLYLPDGLRAVALDGDEILVDVRIPASKGLGSAYLKLRPRQAVDYSSLGVAVALWAEGRRVSHARIVLGAVASRPVRARAAEALLVDQAPTPELLDAVADSAFREATPVANVDMAPLYRRHMVRHFVTEAVGRAWDAAVGGGQG